MIRRSSQSGVALVIVMWVAVIIAVVAGSFIFERRTEMLVVRNSISMARAARMGFRRRARAHRRARRVC